MSTDMATVGLDFGTSTTLVAEAAGTAIRMVPIGRTTPWMETLAGRAGNGWVFGDQVENLPLHHVVRSVKSYITAAGSTPPGGPALSDVEVDYVVGGVLRRSLDAASSSGLDLTQRRVRLGCPAQWVGDQRRRLADIAQSAGLNAHVDDMIDEPIAAGVDWIWDTYLTEGTRQRGRVLVIDIGGGTIDVALLHVEFEDQPEIAVLACRGEALAGDRVDDLLAARLSEHLDASRPGSVDPQDDILGQFLRRAARIAKVRLTTEHTVPIALEAPYANLPRVTLDRADLDDVLRHQLADMKLVIDLTLREAHLRAAGTDIGQVKRLDVDTLHRDVTHVLLAGGMSQIPAIQDAIREHFPNSEVHLSAGDLATTRIVRGYTRSEAYQSLNLNRPGMDIVLCWRDNDGTTHERVLFPAFSPVFERYQVLAEQPVRYEATLTKLPIQGRVLGDVQIRSVSGAVVPLQWHDQMLSALPVMLDSFGTFRLALDASGRLQLNDCAGGTTSVHVEAWPYVRFSGIRSTTAPVVISSPRPEGFEIYLQSNFHYYWLK